MKDLKESKSTWSAVKRELAHLSQSELITLLSDLYGLSSQNKNFVDTRFLKEVKTIDRYKEIIRRYICPDEPWKDSQPISIKEAKKALSDYKKASQDSLGLIELMVYYLECGTDFLCQYGDMYEQYYDSLESVFENTLQLIKQQDQVATKHFLIRLDIVVKKSDGTGYGYYDTISDLLSDFYQETPIA